MGVDFYIYRCVKYGKEEITSHNNIFPSDYRPYISYIKMLDLASLYERIGEGNDWYPNVLDHEYCERCDEINPQFKHVSFFSCEDCNAELKLDYFLYADRGKEFIKVFISHEVVEQFTFDEPYWTVKAEELSSSYCGIGYCNSFKEGTSPFNNEYPNFYFEPKELEFFLDILTKERHIEGLKKFIEEFKMYKKKYKNVFVEVNM